VALVHPGPRSHPFCRLASWPDTKSLVRVAPRGGATALCPINRLMNSLTKLLSKCSWRYVGRYERHGPAGGRYAAIFELAATLGRETPSMPCSCAVPLIWRILCGPGNSLGVTLPDNLPLGLHEAASLTHPASGEARTEISVWWVPPSRVSFYGASLLYASPVLHKPGGLLACLRPAPTPVTGPRLCLFLARWRSDRPPVPSRWVPGCGGGGGGKAGWLLRTITA